MDWRAPRKLVSKYCANEDGMVYEAQSSRRCVELPACGREPLSALIFGFCVSYVQQGPTACGGRVYDNAKSHRPVSACTPC